jgi:long-subunit fatty acid transport protein
MDVLTSTTRGDIFDAARVVNAQEIDDTDWAPAFAVGAVWSPFRGRPSLRMGLSYSYNPSFDLEERFDAVYGAERVPVAGYPRVLRLSVPDRLSLGFAHAGVRLRVAADAVFQRHSELARNSTLLPQVGEIPRELFAVRDTWSAHAGVDWKVLEAHNTYLRAGVYTAPTHAFRYTGPSSDDGRLALSYAFNSRPERTAVGWSVGAAQNFPPSGAARVKVSVAWTRVASQSDEALISLSWFH